MLFFHRKPSDLFSLALVLLVLFLSSLACQSTSGGVSTPTEIVPTPIPVSSSPTTQTLPEATAVQVDAILPSPTATQTQASESSVSSTDFDGVRFNFDLSVIKEVSPQIVPAYTPPQDAAPWDAPMPEYIRFNFNGYPLAGTFFVPKIEVYPIGPYESVNADITSRINDLQDFLRTQPGAPTRIPFLLQFNAQQLFRAGIQYIGFKNGLGVRFLTEYAQYTAPVNNHDLFYTFQGLTNDGKYYVSAMFPVSHPSLPADASQIPGGMDQTFTDDYPKYITEMETTLNSLDPSSFSPDLAKLDALIQSLEITR